MISSFSVILVIRLVLPQNSTTIGITQIVRVTTFLGEQLLQWYETKNVGTTLLCIKGGDNVRN